MKGVMQRYSPFSVAQVYGQQFRHLSNRNTYSDNTYTRKRLEQTFSLLRLNKWTDWYSFTKEELVHKDPSLESLLKKFGGSIHSALIFAFPEFPWQAWRFKEKLPLNWWNNPQNQKEFLIDMGKQLNIQSMEDWYKINSSQLQEHGGGSLLRKYNSFPGVVQAIFTEYKFKPWRFTHGPSADFWKDPKNQRDFMEDLALSLQITEKTGYYKITKEQVKEHGGVGLLKHFNDSYIDIITSVFPDFDWKPWKFKVGVPSGYWADMNHQREFFECLGKELNITNWEEWYSVTSIQICEAGGRGLMDYYYSNSPYRALRAIYPQHDWKIWCFGGVPRGFWENDSNVKEVLLWAEKKLDIKNRDDWFLVNAKMLHNIGLSSLLEKYDRNVFSILQKFYPDHKWDLNYKSVSSIENLLLEAIRDIFSDQQIIPKHKLESSLLLDYQFTAFLPKLNLVFDFIGEFAGDFYPESKKRETICQELGLTLINIPFWWDLSLDSLKATIHSQRSDLCHDFVQGTQPISKEVPYHPKGAVTVANKPSWVWREVRHHREFFDRLAKKLGYHEWRDWYKISIADIETNGGGALLNMYNGSPAKAIMATYPEHRFKQWKFQRVPHNFWENDSNVIDALHWVADELQISKPEEWFNITAGQLDSMGLKGLRDRFSGILNALKKFYPNYDWVSLERDYTLNKDILFSKAQLGLFRCVKDLFPEVSDIHYNYPHPELSYGGKKPFQLDVFIPSLSLAFEYQGAQHYHMHYMFGNPEVTQQHDLDKKLKCINAGITLITVPYWWDGKKESLAATVKEFRSDLLKEFKSNSTPIPIQPPSPSFHPKATDKWQ